MCIFSGSKDHVFFITARAAGHALLDLWLNLGIIKKKKGGGIYLSPSCFLCSLHIWKQIQGPHLSMENRRAPRCEIGDIRISHSAATFWVNHGPSNRCPGPLCSFWLVESLSRVNTTLQYKSIKKFSGTYSQIKYRFKLGKKNSKNSCSSCILNHQKYNHSTGQISFLFFT